jgi:hypothetical protein
MKRSAVVFAFLLLNSCFVQVVYGQLPANIVLPPPVNGDQQAWMESMKLGGDSVFIGVFARTPGPRLAFYRSFDGGLNWNGMIGVPISGENDNNPWLALDKVRRFAYVSDIEGYVARSYDLGEHWEDTMARITDTCGMDQPVIAVDNSAGVYGGRVYFAYRN